ncbi:SDR family oxidoreductase, partial [Methylogaea oryzae]|uniref:SDR family oxidoreductase n=1 Tax=Methylogaea oryzae TaxID=1295382 RepID=UPI0012E1B7CC
EAHLGLSEADRAELRRQGVRAVLHSAGLTRFEEELAERLDWFNRQGTVHAYRLARDLGAAEFHHVSTAFVAGEGDAEGAFSAADLERGQRFRNPYEKSKFEAERFLRAAHAEDGMPINVYRPSICVGGVPPIGKGQSTSTVYAFLKAGHFLKTATLRDLKRGAGSFSRGGGMAGGGGSCICPCASSPTRRWSRTWCRWSMWPSLPWPGCGAGRPVIRWCRNWAPAPSPSAKCATSLPPCWA